jgi:hypothetical protein
LASAISARGLSGAISCGTPPRNRSVRWIPDSHERIVWSAVTHANV